ncbi:MAG: hypothetical protein SFT81_07680 [Candidatus Caenarcaniphilales bacterium]|nr:hypothetical protein [Candidatus Caenarcaniphilales bacterium]
MPAAYGEQIKKNFEFFFYPIGFAKLTSSLLRLIDLKKCLDEIFAVFNSTVDPLKPPFIPILIENVENLA